MYETAIVRQTIPNVTFYPASGLFPPSGASSIDLTPPNSDPGWRFRSMEMMPAFSSREQYWASPSGGYTVPAHHQHQPTEVLVVWERYKENV